MPKPNIHPNFHPVEIKFSNGAVLKTHSSIEGQDSIEVEIAHPINHRAWNTNSEVKAVKKTKFSSISIAASSLVDNGKNPSATPAPVKKEKENKKPEAKKKK